MARYCLLPALLALVMTGALPPSSAAQDLCSDRVITARAVRVASDLQPFVECAATYLAEHGPEEARRAFNEDERWKFGPTYVFVDEVNTDGINIRTLVFPPDPSEEGKVWTQATDAFGTELSLETDRVLSVVGSGWLYYAFNNPATGRTAPKASYAIEVDWDGTRAVLGAGIYSRDWPGTCNADEVSAAALAASPSPATLREFVRCAAMVVESKGYFSKADLEADQRWTAGSHYVFVLDMMGNQVMTGNRVRLDGAALHEWGRIGSPDDQFGGRDMTAVGGTFGETYMYYRSYNPLTSAHQPKVAFLKRVVAQGVPLLVGAGYYSEPNVPGQMPSCADSHAAAAAVRGASDVQAFVQCAVEYVMEHGEEEARRAFNEDARWKDGPMYVFASSLARSGEDVLMHVFPPDPSREGSLWGESIDSFGNDFWHEEHRVLSLVDAGWVYYAFTNPATGLWEPKASYVVEIEWNGERAVIGAGLYRRDWPGTCDPAAVNAADLEANPSEQRLREFVRCAALQVKTSGYFASPALSSDPRWKHGSIYVFGIKVDGGTVEFSGNQASFAASGRLPELLFKGRDVIDAGAVFGEMHWYYNFNNPATGGMSPKVAFVELVNAQGGPLLVGAGYNP